MSKNECSIIRDLLPNYIEKIVSEDTKKFIENHLENCLQCKHILNNMSSELLDNEEKLKGDTNIEIKKINNTRKRMKFHKNIIIIISVILLIFILLFFANKIFNYTLLSNVYEAYKEVNNLDNLKLTEISIYRNYDKNENYSFISELYYKDGKYKQVNYDDINSMNPESTIFGEINSTEKLTVFNKTNKMIKNKNSSIYYKKGQLINNNFVNTFCLPQDRYIHVFNKVESNNFIDRECYVYIIENSLGYTEYWIDKETHLNIRTIESYDKYYRETLYYFERGTTKDIDVENNYSINDFDYSEFETNEMTENLENVDTYIKTLLKEE